MTGQPRSGRALYDHLEKIGRIPLSKRFYLRDFLHSEVAAAYGVVNLPVDLELALHTGRQLCETILEPLQDTFGRIHIRSGYRSPELNALGSAKGLNCASNERNRARHIWDLRDENGHAGACACIVVPWFQKRFSAEEWPRLAAWIDQHLTYHRMVFFSRQAAFNIGWHEKPVRTVQSYAAPRGFLDLGSAGKDDPRRDWSAFPPFRAPPPAPRSGL